MSLPQEVPSLERCRSCEHDLQHCHGTALMMEDGTHVCSEDPDCLLEVDEHWFVANDDQYSAASSPERVSETSQLLA